MECYITYCVKGFFAFDSENKLICNRLFPEEEIINRLAEITDKKIVLEENDIINEVSEDYDEIIIESNKRLSDYDNEKINGQKLIIEPSMIMRECLVYALLI